MTLNILNLPMVTSTTFRKLGSLQKTCDEEWQTKMKKHSHGDVGDKDAFMEKKLADGVNKLLANTLRSRLVMLCIWSP